jgi:predicted dehydrogenase
MVGFMKRFAQKYVMAKQIAEREEFGSPSHLLLRYSFNVSRDRQGFLAGMCSHPLDLARHFMGDYGRMHAEWGQSGAGLWLSLNVRFRSGATGTLIMSGQAPAVVERLELTGDGAMVVVDDVATLEYYPPAEQRWRPPPRIVHRPNMALQSDENNSLTVQGYAGEVRAFIEAVAGGTPPPCATIEDGVAMMEIVEMLASGRSGVLEPDG